MAAIFDMDGLLLDTDPNIWVESMHEVAKAYQVDITTDLLRHTKGLRIYEVTGFWNEYFGWNKPEKAIEMAENILDTVIAKAHEKGTVLPGVKDLLIKMQEAGIPMGVATSSPKRMVDDLLDFFEIKNYFNAINTADKCVLGKPHPEVYIQCAEALNVLPWRCVAFEDSVNGMVAAKAARMQVVAVPTASQFDKAAFGLADLKLSSLESFTLEDYFQLLEI